MRRDLDWIITVGGTDIPPDITKSWTFTDGEEESSFTVVLHNRDLKYSGKFKIDDELTARFGYVGKLGEKVTLLTREVHEAFPTGGYYITVVGKDKRTKMNGDRGTGKYDKDNPKEVATSVVKDTTGTETTAEKVTPATNLNEDHEPVKPAVMNETPSEFLDKILGVLHPDKGSGKAGKSVIPKSGKYGSDFKGKQDKGHTFSGNGADGDKAQGENQGGGAGKDPVTASLKMLGYPELKSKKNISMKEYGPDCSGTYYVKSATHSWSPGSGYLTNASLTRGGIGEGGSGTQSGCGEVICTSDVYGGGKMKIGPRDHDSEAEMTFTRDVDDFIQDFSVSIAPQENTGGGGGKGKGAGHDLTDRAKPTSVKKDDGADKSDDPSIAQEQMQPNQ